MPPERLLCLLERETHGARELIRTGRPLAAAGVAGEKGNEPFRVHALGELSDGLEIAVAAAGERNIVNASVLKVELELRGADALRFVLIVHDQTSLVVFFEPRKSKRLTGRS